MQWFVGTSGFAYPKWRGSFYPEKLRADDMLSFYAGQFRAVEIIASSYRMPAESTLQKWLDETPSSFRFALKAHQAITHRRRLGVSAMSVLEDFLRITSVLKRRRGPVLFQLPPNFKQDLPRLEDFLKVLGRRAKATFEFRHPSWFNDDTYACLRKHRVALCMADDEKLPPVETVSTADWGYVRLRRANYTDRQLVSWIERMRSFPWRETHVYFKHEETGTGPKLATRFGKLLGPNE